MQKIELSNGYVTIKEFIDRKTAREYRRVMFKDYIGQEVEVDVKRNDDKSGVDAEVGKKIKYKFNPEQADELNDVLVLGLVKELFVDGQSLPITKESFDDLADSEFEKIAVACNEMNRRKDLEKKS